MRIAKHAAVVAALAAIALGSGASRAATCGSLTGLSLTDTTITAAQSVPAGTYTAPDGEVFTGLPAFCRVAATLTPAADSSILIEVWMPASPGWNGRYEGTGNGGYAGTIVYGPLADGLQRGFAVANTDMGTAPSTTLNGDALVGHPQKWIDWGYRATHEMTVRSKQIIEAFYGQGAKFSYFTGCSTGGQQALSEAQRFPDDYDGIVGGSPGHNRTHLHTDFVWDFQVARKTPTSLVPQSKLTVVFGAILAACNTQDGGVSTDTWLVDPRDCGFDPASLQCPGADAPNCLTATQVQTMKAIYDGPRNPTNNHLIYPGWPKGSEGLGITGFLESGESATDPAFDSLFKWVFGTGWNALTFDFNLDMAKVDAVLGPILNATNPDLSAFRKHHGKLLLYHGFADGLVAGQDTIDYYNEVVAQAGGDDDSASDDGGNALRKTQKFARLFMVPGMSHCGGGPGANVFNGDDNLGGPRDADHDVLSALVKWVEQGVAPKKVIATKYVNDTPALGVAFTRPICPYPQFPHYDGSGNPDDAASFTCAVDENDFNETAAPEYRR
jgi:feruloyl esterase